MKIKQIRIKDEFIKEIENGLEALIYLHDKVKKKECKKKTDAFMHFKFVFNKGGTYQNIEYKTTEKKDIEGITLNNKNIYDIIANSKYEPFSFYFVKTFFSELFQKSIILKDFKFKREGRNTVGWLYKRGLVQFLSYFTNIEEIALEFIKEVNWLEKILFIEEYSDSQYYKFLHTYIKKNKDLFKLMDDVELLSVDNKFLIIQKEKIIKQLTHRKIGYYASTLRENITTLIS